MEPSTRGSLHILARAMTSSSSNTEETDGKEATKAATSSSETATDEGTQATSEYLKSLTLDILEGVNSRQFEAHRSFAYFAPQWKAQSNDHSNWYPPDQHFEIMKRLTREYPGLWCRPMSISVVMGYRELCADVFLDIEHHGFPPGLVRTSLAVFHWKVFDDGDGGKKWLCTRHTGARGITGIEPLRGWEALGESEHMGGARK